MRLIVAVVVIYNTACYDSVTCQALRQLNSDLPVVIYDNSTKDYGNQQYCVDSGWHYLGGLGNVGLSKAYNSCIIYIKEHLDADVVCLFDDDTKIDSQYFDLLRHAMVDGESKIFVPLIYSKDTLISPSILKARYKIVKFEHEQAALSYVGKELSAINSCMALDLSLFDCYRYDEEIFLDGIDHKFVADMKTHGEQIKVFPYRCEQAFSGDEKPSPKSALTRFLIFKKDFQYILGKDKISYIYLVGKRALNLTLKYKSFEFLHAFFQK